MLWKGAFRVKFLPYASTWSRRVSQRPQPDPHVVSQFQQEDIDLPIRNRSTCITTTPEIMRHFYAASIAPFVVAISMTMSIMSITVSAERHRVSLSEDNVDFNLDYFDDGRTRPYRVVFEGNARNVFDFEASGAVKIMRIGTERYRVRFYRASPIHSIT